MERLTFEGNFCDIAQCREIPCPYNGACSQRKVWERLKAYEDTGLAPKEAKRMSNILMDVGIDYNCSWEYVKNWLLDDRLRELAEADKDGRLVVLPCKAGDTVYSIFGAEVIEKTVGRVIINGYTTPRIWVDLDCSFLSSVTKRWDLGIGKDFFLTREEAEKALEAMK